jgi:hypothetical protein
MIDNETNNNLDELYQILLKDIGDLNNYNPNCLDCEYIELDKLTNTNRCFSTCSRKPIVGGNGNYYCIVMRESTGFFKIFDSIIDRIVGRCGKSGRYFKPKESPI